ncbi:helix-turn-helix domain-containing protein [Candidatus Berkelbacteria bacterium]|nr:helix-turn-helix domain-containing protein [Candidatus Berkelbacteria bacterium]
MTCKSFGVFIASIIEEKKLSARRAGREAGLSGTYVSNMVRGVLPTEETLRQLMIVIAPEKTEEAINKLLVARLVNQYEKLLSWIPLMSRDYQVKNLIWIVLESEKVMPGFIEALWPRLQKNFPAVRNIPDPRNIKLANS